MSSKKIYTSVGLDELVMNHLGAFAKQKERSKSFIVEKALIEYFWGKKELEEIGDADKTKTL